MKIQEMIKKCDECKLPECIQCEYSWSDVQEIKEEVKKFLPQDKKLEWNVLAYNFNTNEIINYNIFSGHFFTELKHENPKTYIELKEFIKKWARYYYWSRTEHEILVGGLFKNCKLEKIDIFRQIEMNLDRITEYVNKELKIKLPQSPKL